MPHIEFVNNVLVQNSISAVSGIFADTLNAKSGISSPDLSLLKTTSSNWDSAFTTVSGNSGNWQSVYNTFKSTSGTFLTSETDSQTLSYSEPSTISISNGNSVSLSSLDVRSLTSNWESSYSTVNTNSASWGSGGSGGSDVSLLSSNWQNTYATVSSNSGTWNYQGNDLKALSSNWESTYNTFKNTSGSFLTSETDSQTLSYSEPAQLSISNGNTVSLSSLDLRSLSSNWELAYTTINANSTLWASNGSDVSLLSSNWESTYNTFKSTSGSFLTSETDSQTLSYSEPAQMSISNGNTVSLSSLDVRSLSSNWQSSYSTVNTNSATNWSYQGADLKALSSNWESTYSVVSSNSASWGLGGGTSGDYLSLSGGIMSGPIYFLENGPFIDRGLVDTSRGGLSGISLVCSVMYDLNWQAGWITSYEQDRVTPRPLLFDSGAGTSIKIWDGNTNSGVEISHTGITFSDLSTLTSASGLLRGDIANATQVPFATNFNELTGSYNLTFDKNTSELKISNDNQSKTILMHTEPWLQIESSDSMNINVVNFDGALGLQAGGVDLVLVGGNDGGGESYMQLQPNVRLEVNARTTVKTNTDSAVAFEVKDFGDNSLFTVDTLNSKIKIQTELDASGSGGLSGQFLMSKGSGEMPEWRDINISSNISDLSGNWQSTYNTVSSLSSSWGSVGGGSDVSGLSGNWESTYSTVSTNSAAWSANPQVIEATVFNADSVSLVRGNVVYSFGATGDTMSVKRASNTSDTTSSKTLGFVNSTIAPGATGTVTVMGRMDHLNLGSFADGDALWLNSSPGVFTNVKPTAPNHGVYLGVVERANSGNGIAYVKIQNGYELNEIHDVLITTPLSGQMLRRNSANTLWVNTDDGTKWDGVYSTVQTNSATAWTYDNTKLPLSGGTLSGLISGTNATFSGTVSAANLYGNLLAKINYYNSSSTTLSLDDAGAIVKIDVNGDNAYLYVDTEANVGWVQGTQIVLVQWGTNTINFIANSGVVINSYSNFSSTKGQYSMATLIYLGSDVWALGGNLYY